MVSVVLSLCRIFATRFPGADKWLPMSRVFQRKKKRQDFRCFDGFNEAGEHENPAYPL